MDENFHKAGHFSYREYINFVRLISKKIPIMDFSQIDESTQQFFIIRHDVEFSIEKAYSLAKIECDHLGISTSYFFQIRNNTYNSFSDKNIQLIKKIAQMGHKIGLHVHLGALTDIAHISTYVKNDINVCQQMTGINFDRYSFHRPPHELLSINLHIPGLINAYNHLFFQHYVGPSPKNFRVKYLADSEHQWKYGRPAEVLTKNYQKVQLLTHPYSWSETGNNTYDTFFALIREKKNEILSSIKDECDHYPQDCQNFLEVSTRLI